MWRRIGLLLGVVALSACASLAPKLKTPKLSVIGASMVAADLFAQQFRVRVHVDNPNARALPIKKLDYTLYLEGDNFAKGVSETPFVVPAQGSTDFDLLVETRFASSLGRLLSRLNGENRNTVRYDFVGKIDVDIAFVPTLAFKESGMVELGHK